MKLHIILILKENYLEPVLKKYNINYNIIRQTINEKICYDPNFLPIVICDQWTDLTILKEKYFDEKIIFLGNKNNCNLSYPLKLIKLFSVIDAVSQRKIRILSDQLFFSVEQQSLFDKKSIAKLTSAESLLCCLLADNLQNNLSKDLISDRLWYKQSQSQKYKNFDNLIYKFRKKLEIFSFNLVVKNNSYFVEKIIHV